MSDKKHPIGEVLGVTMEKVKEMVDTNVIIGEAIHVDDVTIIPVSKISVGFASGGSDFNKKTGKADANFGGGGGAGISVTPVSFLVVQNGSVRILGVDSAPITSLDRALDMLPSVMDKVEGFVDKRSLKKTE